MSLGPKKSILDRFSSIAEAFESLAKNALEKIEPSSTLLAIVTRDHASQQRFRSIVDDLKIRNLLGKADKAAAIVSIGCGCAREFTALDGLLNASAHDIPVKMIGIDCDSNAIQKARKIYESPLYAQSTSSSFEFYARDVRELKDLHLNLPERRLIIMRHHHLLAEPPKWREIYQLALKFAGPYGLVLTTSYMRQEHERALKTFKSLGARHVESLINQHFPVLRRGSDDHEEMKTDGYVCLFTPAESALFKS